MLSPTRAPLSSALSDAPSPGLAGSTKFPHTKAILTAIWREYKPSDTVALLEAEANEDVDDSRGSLDTLLIANATSLLQEEREDELKDLLKNSFGAPDDDEVLNDHVLNIMHKHRDDIAGVPFLFLASSRRPISRPSSRASSHSVRVNRPDTPNSIPSSPLGFVLRRPHTPLASPMNPHKESPSYMSIGGHNSPSPFLPSATLAAGSSPSSPLSSPKLLNAKATEFRPIPRPLSASGSHSSLLGLRTDTPSPDLWSHKSSKLAIASPLIVQGRRSSTSDGSSLIRSSSLEDAEDDEFDPFAIKPPPSFHPIQAGSDFDSSNSASTSSQSRISSTEEPSEDELATANPLDPTVAAPDGMTPLDVLSAVFGSSLSQSELDEALEINGYEFESAMAWLLDKTAPPSSPIPISRPMLTATGSGRLVMISRDAFNQANVRGGLVPDNYGRGHRHATGRAGSKVCRYFLAGECMRADCRFSHDLDRALCRFWLRGVCAKGESCEFLHHLPQEAELHGVTSAMANHHLSQHNEDERVETKRDDFPSLEFTQVDNRGNSARSNFLNDPGRTRFASAVKRPATNQSRTFDLMDQKSRFQHGQALHAVVAPKPSPRLKLRMPTLLPTVPTGESLNSLYMEYRSRALQLGAARNASLSRAAEAWRRGDGASAKRFSREGHDFNNRMKAEAAVAAGRLVRERAKIAINAVRSRDAAWSDDPGDRAMKGRVCGGGLGVMLGIASVGTGSEAERLTPEERTEVMLDLHGLHSGEATDVLEEYLLALEKEHFLGLVYLIVGEQKHTGSQDPNRGVSKARLAAGVKDWLHKWGYPWMEREGIVVVDPLTHT